MTFQVFFFFLLAAVVVYKFDPEYAKFLLILAGKIMFLVSAIGVIYFGPNQLQKIVENIISRPKLKGWIILQLFRW